MLVATIGLPYFLLSTTSPLVQAWFSRAPSPGASPYRLFALSNLASMLALVGYPFLLEPWAPTREQAIGWSVGYALFVVLCAAAGWAQPAPRATRRGSSPLPGHARRRARDSTTTSRRRRCRGSCCGARWRRPARILLLAVSNHITQNIAAVPLLWIAAARALPADVHPLLRRSGWYRRDVFLSMAGGGARRDGLDAGRPQAHPRARDPDRRVQRRPLPRLHVLPRRAARLKPAPRYLTRFYLMISVGGAVGAVLVGILAPLVLPGLLRARQRARRLSALLLLWQVRRDPPVYGVLGLVAAAGGRRLRDLGRDPSSTTTTIVASRNFYGVLRVQESRYRRHRGAGRWSTARSCTARSTRSCAAARADDLLHARRPASAGCSQSLHPRLEPYRSA